MDLTSESAKRSRKRKQGGRAYFCIFVFVFFAAFRIGLFEKFLSQDTPVNLVSNESAKIAYFGESFKIN